VALNTRLNALGGGANLSHSHRLLAKKAASKFAVKSTDKDQIEFCLHGSKRFRSEDFSYAYSSDGECCPESPTRLVKRFRSATFPLSPEPSMGGCLKVHEPEFATPLVSQESLNTLEDEILSSRRKVKFLDEIQRFYPASVTPDLLSFDEEQRFASLQM
jgi:hypothetical protein